MQNKKVVFILRVILLLLPGQIIFAQDNNPGTRVDFYGSLGGDFRYFHQKALYEGQHNSYFSSVFRPQVFVESKNKNHTLNFIGFARLDQYDDARTHADIRDLYWRFEQKKWEVNTGVKVVSWGKTESNHLADIINQYDLLEGRSLEHKLGQPMLQFIFSPLWASMEFYVLPYFRTLQFPGKNGRMRPGFELDFKNPEYEIKNADSQPDLAVRITRSVGNFDVGISHFQGTNRLPVFKSKNQNSISLFYEEINQTALEFQWIVGPLIWKAEGVNQVSKRQKIQALTVGGEYSIYFLPGPELKIMMEYTYDERGKEQISGIDNDLFAGLNLNLNDRQSTNIMVAGYYDLELTTTIINSKIERRLGEGWKIIIMYNGIFNADPHDFYYLIRNDSFLEFSLYHYF